MNATVTLCLEEIFSHFSLVYVHLLLAHHKPHSRSLSVYFLFFYFFACPLICMSSPLSGLFTISAPLTQKPLGIH